MLTAKEILEKHYKNHEKRIAYPENVLAAMIEYATLACEEQRKLDAQLVSEKMKGAKGMCMAIDILLTPLPTLK